MYKVRVCFEKQSYAKYVSNLDMMRMFQRVFKIAKVDIAYSQGFNPHQKLSIANPLPIGVTGSGEFLEIQVNSEPDYEKLVKDLNQALPEDIKVLWAEEPKTPLSEIKISEYSVEVGVLQKIDNFSDYIKALEVKEDIVVAKKTKKGISNVDIKPHIHKIEIEYGDGYVFKMKMLLSTSEECNLKATTVLDAFKKYIPNFEIDYYIINRDGFYKQNMMKFER